MNDIFFEKIIGVESHIRLKTENKLFCNCNNKIDNSDIELLNINICGICTGVPGTLPKLNLECISLATKLASSLQCKIPEIIVFDRKQYDFPDMPKMRQTTMESNPLGINGTMYLSNSTVFFDKLCVEEDAGKTISIDGKIIITDDRSGSPLIELVTSPCFISSEQVIEYLKVLKNLCIYLDLINPDDSSCIRSDVNISISIKNENNEIIKKGERVEIKNINSFTSIKNAINFEFERQKKLLSSEENIKRETRGWDAENSITYFMRSKEEFNDYLFIPEYDIPPFKSKNLIQNKINPYNFFFQIFNNEKNIQNLDDDRLKRLFEILVFADLEFFNENEQKTKFFIDLFSSDNLFHNQEKNILIQIFTMFKNNQTDLKQIIKYKKILFESDISNYLELIRLNLVPENEIKSYIVELLQEYPNEKKDFYLKNINNHFNQKYPDLKINFNLVLKFLNE